MAKLSQSLVVAGALVAIVAVVVAVWLLRPDNKEVDLALGLVGTSCTVTTPVAQKNVENPGVSKNGKMTWHIRNYCPTDQVVSVGNFRTSPATSNTNCSSSTEGGATWPFHANDETMAKRSTTAQGSTSNPPPTKIELHDAKNDGTSPLTYYFSVCIGTTVVDPRLVIEP